MWQTIGPPEAVLLSVALSCLRCLLGLEEPFVVFFLLVVVAIFLARQTCEDTIGYYGQHGRAEIILSACDYVPVRVAKRLERIVRETRDFPGGRALASVVRLWPGTESKILAQGIDDVLDIAGRVFPRETIEVSFKYAYVWMRREPTGLPKWAGKLAKSELPGLLIGLGIDVGYQAWLDKPLRDAGYLTPEQSWGRLRVEVGGSFIGWLSGLGGTALGGPVVGIAVGVVVDALYDEYLAPLLYERRGLYPTDPTESRPK